MNVKEVLQFADELVFAQTGKHLDDIQETVIKGVWQGHTYEKIANQCNRSESHVRDIGYKLWQIFSEQLDQDINKRNFRSTLSRLQVTSSPIIIQNNTHNFNFCSSYQPNSNSNNCTENIQSTRLYHDLTLAPKITHFYNRTTELQTLSDWLTNQNTRLISVLGLSGIGKTTLVKQFVDLNLQQFDIVIWKSLKLSQSLDRIITEILMTVNTESIETDNKLTQLFNLLRQQKSLIILDDVQELFTKGQFAGQYQTEYKDYKTFFTMMIEIEHQSSLILISQEQCQEMLCLDEDLYPVKCLELEGIENIKILTNLGLNDEESWLKLIDLYEGNPIYLKDIASLIRTIFAGKVSEFLREDTLLVTEEIKFRFNQLFERLSPIEQQIAVEVSKSSQPVSREDLRQSLSLSSMDLINGLQSLSKRYLLKTTEGDKIGFKLSPIFQEYLRTLA
ncbi:MAG TPA: ATPase domain-containing protein [Cyanobacteria bacterium UBA11162]|nr:ATPase domain-containing protein [Cyanobacteria bacterium UBA11162]